MEDKSTIIIPMDDAIAKFKGHLMSHPRTILSSKFGDGKSFFLAEAEKQLSDSFCFLKIYPINYQVAENNDIFEYIKRDLLFQMFGQGLVEDSYVIPDNISATFFLFNNWKDISDSIFSSISVISANEKLNVGLGALRFLRHLKNSYDSFKDNGGPEGTQLDSFIESFDHKGIYESDAITSILRDIIALWKEKNPRKRLCLVFEDMDRIDPNHIFRILNIISAHTECCGFIDRQNYYRDNKFGVDNIVVCLDYDNLKTIFFHFYGGNADFQGYINKFSDRGYFQYSIKTQAKEYYIKQLSAAADMEEQAVAPILAGLDINTYNLRKLFHSIDDVDSQYELPVNNMFTIPPPKGLFVIIAALKRLGFISSDICNMIGSAILNYPEKLLKYLGYWMLMIRYQKTPLELTFGQRTDSGYLKIYIITLDLNNQKELVQIERHLYGSYNGYYEIDAVEEIEQMLPYIYE